MKKIFLIGLMAAAVVFTGCNKDDAPKSGNGKDKKTVILTIDHDKTAGTRAESDRTVDHQITLREGFIFFVDGAGRIVRYVEMKTGATPGVNEIELPVNLSNPVTIEDVPTSALKCCIFANIPSVTKAAIAALSINEGTTSFKSVLSLDMGLNDLVDNVNWGVAKMPQFGEGTVTLPSSDGDPMTTTVRVYAMGSRLQIAKLTGHTDIVDYKLEGIFVNNYFAEMPVSSTLDYDDIINNGSDVTKYTATYAPYVALNISDFVAGGLADVNPVGTDVEATPLTKDVWAYNIWPTEGLPAADRLAATPRLIFVFRDVEYKNGPSTTDIAPGPLYLTVKGMKKGGTQVPAVEKGNSYTFTNIQFEFKDLTSVPEVDLIEAEVTIQMIDWKDNDVEEIL